MTALTQLKSVFNHSELDLRLNNTLDKIQPMNRFSSRFNLSIETFLINKFYLYFFIDKKITESKQSLHLFGSALNISICTFNSCQSLKLWVRNPMYLLLSDNKSLITDFGSIKDDSYDSRISEGNLVPCIQAVIREDWESLKQLIQICKDKHLGNKDGDWIKPDLDALEGIMERNITKVEQAIHVLATKDHLSRNDESIFNELISIPATGYAKLAWLKGLEVETNSPLIPKELLPINPNDEYWEFDYMKEKEFQCKS